MSRNKLSIFLSASLKSSVAILPLVIAVGQMSASAQTKTQAQLEAEAASAKAAAAAVGSDADDAAAIAQLTSGLTGTSTTSQNSRDIVVTGTNIRGVAPTGTNLSVLSKDDLDATGQSSMGQLLANIPGFGTFNQLPNNNGAAAQGGTQISRPNLRGTPDGDNGAAGLGDPGSSTLILIDGNRQSGGGVRAVATDPESIAPSLLERVEINTDGASAAYGSDAIGGVVNFVTRRKYDGVEASGHLGYADDYWQYDGNLLAGKDWGSGSFYVNGAYAANTPLWVRDRDYLGVVAYDTGLLTGTNCDIPNLSIASSAASGTGTTFIPALPAHFYRVNADGSIARPGDVVTAGATGTRTTIGTGTPVGGLASAIPAAGQPTDASRPVLCNLALNSTRINKKKRYSGMVNFSQKITDNIDFLARGNYSYVSDYGIATPITISMAVSPNNPFRQELTNLTGTSDATYPTVQTGFTVPQDDVKRPCTVTTSTAVGWPNCRALDGTAVPVGTLVAVPQSVATNLSQAYGYKDNYVHNWSKKFGGSAEVTWRIDGNWQLKATGVYDRTATFVQYGVNGTATLTPYIDGTLSGTCTAAIAAITAAGGRLATTPAALAAIAAAKLVCLNPYNIEASNPTILAAAHDIDTKSLAHNAIIDFKVNADGTLFEIPGGKVRVAVGAEYIKEDLEKWQYTGRAGGNNIPFSDLPTNNNPALTIEGSRWSWSVYGEANIPLVSRANALTWIKELRLNLSGRYDQYKIFGGTFNPKVGASFKPTDWLTFRGNWNSSFRAPSILLSISAEAPLINIDSPTSSQVPYALTNPRIDNAQVAWIFNAGGTGDLKPQTGNQWSVGIDVAPFRGFRASVSYGHIDYYDFLSSPNIFALVGQRGNTDALANIAGLTGIPGQGCVEASYVVVLDPRLGTGTCTNAIPLTPAQVTAAKAAFCAIAVNCADAMADGRDVYALYDTRYRNTGNSKIANVDYDVRYNSRTPWGQVFFSVKGSIKLINKTQSSVTAAFTNNSPFTAAGGSRHAMTAQAGFVYGPLRASATLLHSDGYRVARSAVSPQDRVGDFNTVNVYGTWDFKGDNVVERNLQLSLSINNILNTSPPVRYTNNTVTTANGSTLGRLIQVGFQKKF